MERVAALQELYQNYNAEATKVRKSASWFDGIFGMGNDPRKHYCHDAFYENAGKWTQAFVASNPSAEIALAAATWILEAPAKNRNTEGYWYMFAAMAYADPLVPLLRKEDCKTLTKLLDDLYPKVERMPVQQNLYKKLIKAGK